MPSITELAQTIGIWGYKRFIAARPPGSLPVRAFVWTYERYKTALEAAGSGALRHYCEAPGVVIDVGANVGYFALRFADWIGQSGAVIAIEPEPRNLSILRARLERHGVAERVRVVQAAAGAQAGSVTLMLNPAHPGDHKVSQELGGNDGGADADGITVDLVALDALALPDGPPVRLIKIDTQGHELEVLHGARETIARHLPALYLEVDAAALRRNGASIPDLTAFLAAFDYSYWTIDRRERLQPLSRTALEAYEAASDGSYLDVLCVQNDRSAA